MTHVPGTEDDLTRQIRAANACARHLIEILDRKDDGAALTAAVAELEEMRTILTVALGQYARRFGFPED